MRKQINNTEAIFPMPVLMIATYNEDNTIDVMNAAWATMFERDEIILNLTESHKTVKNIMARKAFTVSLANAKNVKIADYFGVTSANNTDNKFEMSGLSASKSNLVDAPIINEFPICMECKLLDGVSNWGIVGKIVNVTADEKVLSEGNVDISLLDAIAFDPYTHGYYKVTEKVGNAFSDGLELKK